MWEENARAKVRLGTIMVETLEDGAVCDAITFDPINLPEGIAGPENDRIFAARSGAYAVSLIRRAMNALPCLARGDVLPQRGRLHLDIRDVHLDQVANGDEAD